MTRAVLRSAPLRRTYYEVLGLPPASSYDALHTRYRELAEQHHPDKGGDGDKFREIALAWGVLKDAAARKRYDTQLYLEGNQCGTCGGSGIVARFENRRYNREALCKACGGTGKAGSNAGAKK
jgi:DnaJ-class molecular chaperone